jgi:hypothetical protein
MQSNNEREPPVFWQIEEGFCFSVSVSYVHDSGKLAGFLRVHDGEMENLG